MHRRQTKLFSTHRNCTRTGSGVHPASSLLHQQNIRRFCRFDADIPRLKQGSAAQESHFSLPAFLPVERIYRLCRNPFRGATHFCLIGRENPIGRTVGLYHLNARMASFSGGADFRKAYLPDARRRILCRMRFEYRYERTVPRLSGWRATKVSVGWSAIT